MPAAGKKSISQTIRKQAADWALRIGERDVSFEERNAFEAWIATDAAHAHAFEAARGLLGDARTALVHEPEFTRRLLRQRDGTPWGKMAVAGLVLGGGLCLFFLLDGPMRLQADVMTQASEMPVVTLQDGTRVFLNGNSAIAEDFTNGRRQIRLLKGEAYFEVAKDPNHPFVVQAGAGQVEVLGTAFNINIVDGEAEVTVTESRVAVAGAASSTVAVLGPGDRIAYDAEGRLGSVEGVPQGFEAPWRSGRLVFDDRPLSKVVQEIFRHLPGKVVIAGPGVGKRHISGSFDLSDPAEALSSFGRVFGLRIVRAGPLLTVIY